MLHEKERQQNLKKATKYISEATTRLQKIEPGVLKLVTNLPFLMKNTGMGSELALNIGMALSLVGSTQQESVVAGMAAGTELQERMQSKLGGILAKPSTQSAYDEQHAQIDAVIEKMSQELVSEYPNTTSDQHVATLRRAKQVGMQIGPELIAELYTPDAVEVYLTEKVAAISSRRIPDITYHVIQQPQKN